MNYPSRTDETLGHNGWNQNPNSLSADATTQADLNGISNTRLQSHLTPEPKEKGSAEATAADLDPPLQTPGEQPAPRSMGTPRGGRWMGKLRAPLDCGQMASCSLSFSGVRDKLRHTGRTIKKYTTFIGPGFMIAVAYIDPGNYSTDVAAGSSYRFKLLFVILMSNLFAVFLQSLCVKLGTVTGLNLAEHCRAHLPMWLNLLLYVFAEAAIIATDIAEVIGSAIALNLLFHIPLVAGCAITLLDVLVILLFYSPTGSMGKLRAFEFFVMALVLGVVICFCIQLSLIKDTGVGEVLKGYIPSSSVVQSEGLYLSCGILGATVMPHSLYLGSGIVQSRLRDFDKKAGHLELDPTDSTSDSPSDYRPSIGAIRSCLKYSVAEVAISLFTFALFVNSAILIVAGASLSGNSSAGDADLFGIHDLLSKSLSPAAGTIFALALLLSGTSAGIICTIAGQMVSEGALNWTLRPWLRRLLTRAISITPSIIIAGAVGKDGLSAALNGTQVALSVILPFVSAPLVYFTCRNRYMTVPAASADGEEQAVKMRNSWFTAVLAVLIWLVIAIMNIALLVLLGLGKG